MRKMIRASLLTLVLSCTTYGGHIPNGVQATPTPEPTPESVLSEPAESDAQDSQAVEDTVSEMVLSLLQSALLLF